MNQYDLNFKFCKDGLFIWNELFFFNQIIYLLRIPVEVFYIAWKVSKGVCSAFERFLSRK